MAILRDYAAIAAQVMAIHDIEAMAVTASRQVHNRRAPTVVGGDRPVFS